MVRDPQRDLNKLPGIEGEGGLEPIMPDDNTWRDAIFFGNGVYGISRLGINSSNTGSNGKLPSWYKQTEAHDIVGYSRYIDWNSPLT